MTSPHAIEQAGLNLGSISHLRVQRSPDKTDCLFELDASAAKAVDVSMPCTIYDESGQAHVVRLAKIFFSQWAFRAHGTVLASGCTDQDWNKKT